MILHGDCLEMLRTLPDESVDCCCTSPPYFGLRDYGVDGQIGLERTPDEFVARLVEVFREVRRVLKPTGTCWVNLGDSYAKGESNNGGYSDKSTLAGFSRPDTKGRRANESGVRRKIECGLKPKDLVGIPWRVAFALQTDGWYLRSDIIWAKPNPMPESVKDRPTKAHEYIFLLTKSERYWYDADAIAEDGNHTPQARDKAAEGYTADYAKGDRFSQGERVYGVAGQRNARTVWSIATQPYPEAHFATYPEELPKRCILAGCPEGGTVLDPFLGSGTTAAVAVRLGRKWIGIELNPEYARLAEERIGAETPSLFGGEK